MSEGHESRTCRAYDCEKEAEFLLYLPEWGEAREVCRQELSKIGDGVDARTMLQTGYAKPIGTPGELPREPPNLPDKMVKDMLEQHMGWEHA